MKFKTEENLPAEAADVFRSAGHNADTVWDEALAGADDATIAGRIRSEQRILVTSDLDSGNIRAYPPDDHPGLMVLRLRHQDKANAVDVLKRIVLALGHWSPEGELWIIDADRIRFRQGRLSR